MILTTLRITTQDRLELYILTKYRYIEYCDQGEYKGLCFCLAEVLRQKYQPQWIDTNIVYLGMDEHFPELHAQKPPFTAGNYWWDTMYTSKRLLAIDLAIALTTKKLNYENTVR